MHWSGRRSKVLAEALSTVLDIRWRAYAEEYGLSALYSSHEDKSKDLHVPVCTYCRSVPKVHVSAVACMVIWTSLLCYKSLSTIVIVTWCWCIKYSVLIQPQAKRRVLLTGTPLQNNLLELISLLSFVMPEIFQEYADHLKKTFSRARVSCIRRLSM